MKKKLYGIWCKENNKGDWLRSASLWDRKAPILAFHSLRAAQKRAAEEYGYHTYSEARKDGWVEVKTLSESI